MWRLRSGWHRSLEGLGCGYTGMSSGEYRRCNCKAQTGLRYALMKGTCPGVQQDYRSAKRLGHQLIGVPVACSRHKPLQGLGTPWVPVTPYTVE